MEGIIELKTVRDKGIKNPVYETDWKSIKFILPVAYLGTRWEGITIRTIIAPVYSIYFNLESAHLKNIGNHIF